MKSRSSQIAALLACSLPSAAFAGPPYVTDDPDPTETGHYEIYLFASGTRAREGRDGAAGLDLSYGAAPDLQLSLTLPFAYEHPNSGPFIGGIGNVEIAAKYRILHQEIDGIDLSVFPRIFLPSASDRVGDQRASLFLPVWLGKHMGKWTTFGGGGCAFSDAADSKTSCLAAWAVTYRVRENFEVGAEIYHQTPEVDGDHPTTGLGFGARYDKSETFHFVGSIGPGIQNAAETNQLSVYAAVLFTF
ncbi:MAG TPA: transporter [Steroidobacteraceae bacterium]|jgi:hypothetical protein|nr:transporter [Steroidobacteraceae bacterium]